VIPLADRFEMARARGLRASSVEVGEVIAALASGLARCMTPKPTSIDCGEPHFRETFAGPATFRTMRSAQWRVDRLTARRALAAAVTCRCDRLRVVFWTESKEASFRA
jgi:hypothetical protein